MYKRLFEDETKKYYNQILKETMEMIDKYSRQTSLPLYNNISSQLLDIKNNIVEDAVLTDPDDINDRYTLGSIAIHNFDDGDELQERLIDIFRGACDYQLLD